MRHDGDRPRHHDRRRCRPMHTMMTRFSDATGSDRRRHVRDEGLRGSDAGSPGRFRRRRAPAAQLLLLGAQLFQHPGVLGGPVGVRRPSTASTGSVADMTAPDQGLRRHRRAHPAAGRPVAADHRHRHDHAADPAGHPHHVLRAVRPDGADDRHRDRDGTGIRRLQERRLLLPAAGGVAEPRLQARPEAVPVTRRQGRPLHHHPRRRSGDRAGISAVDDELDRRPRSGQGHPAGRRQGLPHGNCGDLPGHPEWRQVRPDDRRPSPRSS